MPMSSWRLSQLRRCHRGRRVYAVRVRRATRRRRRRGPSPRMRLTMRKTAARRNAGRDRVRNDYENDFRRLRILLTLIRVSVSK